jgi:hypothetical protein
MAKDAPAEQGAVGLVVRYPVNATLPLPASANYFHFARMGYDVQLSVGIIDLARVTGDPQVRAEGIEPTITHRFMMSLGSLVALRTQLEAIVKAMEAQGTRLPDIQMKDVK